MNSVKVTVAFTCFYTYVQSDYFCVFLSKLFGQRICEIPYIPRVKKVNIKIQFLYRKRHAEFGLYKYIFIRYIHAWVFGVHLENLRRPNMKNIKISQDSQKIITVAFYNTKKLKLEAEKCILSKMH